MPAGHSKQQLQNSACALVYVSLLRIFAITGLTVCWLNSAIDLSSSLEAGALCLRAIDLAWSFPEVQEPPEPKAEPVLCCLPAGRGREELLLLQESAPARPPATPSQPMPRAPAALYLLSDGRGGGTPVAAFPVLCPDGRTVYHLYPTTPRAVRSITPKS